PTYTSSLSLHDALPIFEILNGRFHLFTARALVFVRGSRGRLRPRHRRTAALGFFFPGQEWINKDPCDAAERGGGEKAQCQGLHFHRALRYTLVTTSAASSAAASRFSSL